MIVLVATSSTWRSVYVKLLGRAIDARVWRDAIGLEASASYLIVHISTVFPKNRIVVSDACTSVNYTSVKFKGHRCFKDEWAGFDAFRPINVIIGRNNSGKSHLLDLVESLCTGQRKRDWKLRVTALLSEPNLKAHFSPNHTDSELGGNLWRDHGKYFVDTEATAEIRNWGPEISGTISFATADQILTGVRLSGDPYDKKITDARTVRLIKAMASGPFPLSGRKFKRVTAERNVIAETPNSLLALGADGSGATNVIRRHLNTAHSSYPPERIQIRLREALNEIFGPDGNFTAINVAEHDEPEDGQATNTWEIYLTQEHKGRVALSRSGSGLKTVLLVLLQLIVMPEVEHFSKDSYVYAFEELENNLHPALLRRLFRYIERHVAEHKAVVFFTTHSSTALDVFGVNPDAQIIHVSHDGKSARTRTIGAHFDKAGVVAELGTKPSDLLQANGVVWVEGPSDRIYINRWIELASEMKLKEGRDYVCAFYGGALLANDQFTAPDEADPELSNLLRVNGNIAVVCDSDRTGDAGEGSELKGRVVRIQAEVSKIPKAGLWITGTKEIENYLPEAVVRKVFADPILRAPTNFERFFPSEKEGVDSYVEAVLKRKTIDKVTLATKAVREMTLEDMLSRFDWEVQITKLVQRIEDWNK